MGIEEELTPLVVTGERPPAMPALISTAVVANGSTRVGVSIAVHSLQHYLPQLG